MIKIAKFLIKAELLTMPDGGCILEAEAKEKY